MRVFTFLCLVLSTVVLALLWLTDVPLGVAGEWTWHRIDYPVEYLLDLALGGGIALFFGGIYLAYTAFAAGRISAASPRQKAAWLGGLCALGFFWLWNVQQAPRWEYSLAKVPWVLYYPASSGYFYEARYHIDDTDRFLAGYESLMEQGDVLHVGTHPPGLFVAHRLLIGLVKQIPPLQGLVESTIPDSAAEAFQVMSENAAQTPTPIAESDQAAIWLAFLLTQIVAVATMLPLYGLLRRELSPQTSWLAVSFWPLVPALAVFLPKSDALYPFGGVLLLWVSLISYDRRSNLGAFFAGVICCVALCFSLAFLPVVLCALLLTGWNSFIAADNTPPTRSELVRLLALSAAGFFVVAGCCYAIWGLNLFAIWSWNFRNHAGFYAQFPRTYALWLFANLGELVRAAGVPLCCAAAAVLVAIFRRQIPWRTQQAGAVLIPAAVWCLLWISGKNMGEAARLWLVFLPWLIWIAGQLLPNVPAENARLTADQQADGNRALLRCWLPVAALQLVVCLLTVVRLYGFGN